MSEEKAVEWLMRYGLSNKETAEKNISLIKINRSYVINYNYGQDIIKEYIQAKGGTSADPAKRWELFEWLLKNPITLQELLENSKFFPSLLEFRSELNNKADSWQ